MKTLQEKLKALPKARQAKIKKRVKQLAMQEMTMRELRTARKITQAQLAKALGVNQEQVSRSEKRTDMHLSTLKRSVEALGGKLNLIAEFPDRGSFKITGFSDAA